MLRFLLQCIIDWLCAQRDALLKLWFPLPALVPGGVEYNPWLLFAAEDEGRTEEPTELRKRREREKGRVPKSNEIPAALGTLAGLLVLFATASWLLSGLTRLIRVYVGNFASLGNLNMATLGPHALSLARDFMLMLVPFFAAVMLLGIAGNLVQTGFIFSLEPLRPKLSNIAFTFNRMVERVFFSKQVYANLIKTLAKILLLTAASYFVISSDFVALLKTGNMGVGESLRLLGFIAFKLALVLVVILLIMAIPDYFFQRSQFLESLKMTKQEVKQEYREQEGDPLIKSRQRQRMREALRLSMRQAVAKADLVITNPVHYAVAIRFAFEEEGIPPRLVAKGADELARIIREVAKQHNIPIHEDKPLARFIYENVELDQVLPQQILELLAQIVISIPSLEAKFRQRRQVA
ncbi:MAG: EscU/YscU/HrcU family type III secretion system export apparatus switch protein [Leptospiraceae bacterium]|nr:EscU/YscU/HrcU family type III secretion system export apparatus switch protein [Leptospiraceae bacterium]